VNETGRQDGNAAVGDWAHSGAPLPDELPASWCWVRLDDLLAAPLANGRSVPDSTDPAGGFPVLRLTALKDGRVEPSEHKIGAWSAVDAASFVVQLGDFLVARGNGSKSLVGRGGLVAATPAPVAFPDTLIRVRIDERLMAPGYLRAVWNSDILRRQIEATARTTAGIYKINQQDMRGYLLPLPPLPEQHRIVAEIETQLTRLEAAVAALERARANLKRYRAAVLKAACEGRLVPTEAELARAEGRAYESASALLERINSLRRSALSENGRGPYREPVPADSTDLPDIPEGWSVVSMDQLTTKITSGSRDWSQYYGRGTGVFLMAQNIKPGRLDLSYKQLVDPPADSRDRARSQVELGDLLVTIVGANTGDVCRVPTDLPEHFVCQSVALMRPVDEAYSRYLTVYMTSEESGQRQYRRYIYGQGRPHLSFDQLRMTAVLLPPLAEQHRIVAEVERRLSVVEELERAVAHGLTRAEKLRQAILRRAFAGKLVLQDPNDEPASVLLERIRAERAAAGVGVAKGGSRTRVARRTPGHTREVAMQSALPFDDGVEEDTNYGRSAGP
jgi:type I restriction enzyme S subunit